MIKTQTKMNSEAVLVRRIAAGDEDAERELFQRFHLIEKVSLIVRARIQTGHDTHQDLVGEIISLILELLRAGKYDPARGSLGSYLSGVSRNKIYEYLRRQKKTPIRNDIEPDQLGQPVEQRDGSDNKELRERFARITHQLDPKFRQVIILRYYHELSVEEIGDQLQLTVKQVYNRLNYAIRLLRAAYNELLNE